MKAIIEAPVRIELADDEMDGAWFLLSDEDRAELEAAGWKDGKPPADGSKDGKAS